MEHERGLGRSRKKELRTEGENNEIEIKKEGKK
jgi:hypothetical protein